jgi:cell division protein FtsW (lipid II flippase)
MFVVGAYTAYRLFSHVQERVEIWLHPFRDPFGASFQLVQGIFGLATGGLFGSGPGRGSPWRIFAANTDFILASYGEELGAVGLMALLVLYGLLIARGLRVALIARDGFGKLLAAGLATAFALQVFVVAGGVLRVIPLTGLVLPFLAYGGSSLLANAALLGMLLRISDAGRRPPPPSGNAPLYDPRAIADSPTQAVQL